MEQPAQPPFGGPDGGAARRDERAAKRFACSGRAKVTSGNGVTHDGKMFDISRTGGCVMLENRIPIGTLCSEHNVVFKAVKTQDFIVQAVCMHATLVGDKGFKHGFQFERPGDQAMKAIAALTESTGTPFA